MWGALIPGTSFNAPQRAVEFPRHVAERTCQRAASADQHVVMAGGKGCLGLQPHHFAQAAADAVALDGIADLLRHGKADPDSSCRLSRFVTAQRLQHERLRRRACAGLGDGPKFRPAF
jgi:hypothetical protein